MPALETQCFTNGLKGKFGHSGGPGLVFQTANLNISHGFISAIQQIGEIDPFSKFALTIEPMMQFGNSLREGP